jgi:hypothetical protein
MIILKGCAVLLPEDIRAVPYWIDDSSLKSSIISSGASKLLEQAEGANKVKKIPFDLILFFLFFFILCFISSFYLFFLRLNVIL